MNPRKHCLLLLFATVVPAPVVRPEPTDVVSPRARARIGPSASRVSRDLLTESASDGESPWGRLVGPAATDVPLGGSNEPTIAVNPLNPRNIAYASLWELRVSNDGGANFEAVVPALTPEPNSAACGDPSLAFDSLGRLFWTYLRCAYESGINIGYDLYIAQCDPITGAILPGYPINVTASPGVNLPADAGTFHDKEWLAADSNSTSPFKDRLYIVWTEFPSAGPVRVLTTSSGDQGLTWTAAIELSVPAEGFVWPTHNTVAPNGDVYVAYHSQTGWSGGSPNGISGRVYVLRSTDGGASYPHKTLAYLPGEADMTFNVQDAGATIPQTQFWLQGSVQPWVLADPNTPGRIYVVANDDPDNDNTSGDPADVFINISEDDGLTWGMPARIDSGPGSTFQVMPTAGIDRQTGCIFVHYYDNRAGAVNPSNRFLLDVFMTASTDGGLSFLPDFQINDAPFDPDRGAPFRFSGPPPTTRIGEYNGVAVAQCTGYAVWCGNTGFGQQTIFDSAAAVPPVEPCELDKLTAGDDAATGDFFGGSVSISGDCAVIGASNDACEAGADCGSAYVFCYDGSDWLQKAKLTASDADTGDLFARWVAISGDVVLVGARLNDDAGSNSGSAYVFEKPVEGWVDMTETAKLTASDAAQGDMFGGHVSLSGDVAVVPAHRDDCADGADCGAAYVFQKPGGGWVNMTETAKLTAFDAAAGDVFGARVSIDGDVVVIGATLDDCADGADCGSAYVFERPENGWEDMTETAKLTAFDAAAGDNLASVGINGDSVVLGASWDDCADGADCGAAYVFEKVEGVWTQKAKLTASDAVAGDVFGWEVSIGVDIVLIGAHLNDDAGNDSGSAYLFRKPPGGWENMTETGKLFASDGAAGDEFGQDLSISGESAIVGAALDDTNPVDAGSAYVFGVAGDCNYNGIDDVCDIRDGTSPDKDGNGVPDECTCERGSRPEPERLAGTPLRSPLAGGMGEGSPQGAAAAAVDPVNVKNRFLSIKTADPGLSQAIRVRFVSLPAPFDAWDYENTGLDFYAGVPREACENSGKGLETAAEDCPDALPARTFWTAPLLCDKESAHVMDWHGQCPPSGNCVGGLLEGEPCSVDDDCAAVVHLYHEGIVPSGAYDVQVVDPIGGKVPQTENCYSAPLRMTQAKWGDLCGPVLQGEQAGACRTVSDGTADVTNDVLGVLEKFTNVNLLQKTRADLGPGDDGNNNGPDFVVDVAIDVLLALAAFTGAPYPYLPGDPCAPGLALAQE